MDTMTFLGLALGAAFIASMVLVPTWLTFKGQKMQLKNEGKPVRPALILFFALLIWLSYYGGIVLGFTLPLPALLRVVLGNLIGGDSLLGTVAVGIVIGLVIGTLINFVGARLGVLSSKLFIQGFLKR